MHLIREGRVEVLGERVAFRRACCGLGDEIECLQLPEGRQQFFNLKQGGEYGRRTMEEMHKSGTETGTVAATREGEAREPQINRAKGRGIMLEDA